MVVNETYGNNNRILLSVKDVTNFVLHVDCETIYGTSEKEVCTEYAFKESANTLSSITFPKGSKLTTIGDCAFSQCSKLPSIDFSNCELLTVIGINAFANCISLSNVILPSNLEIIPTKCFISCSIKSINILNKVKIIGERSFANNWQLKSVTITDYSDLQKIEAGSFYGAIIETIFIPKGVSSLAGAAFETSKTLRTIVGNPSNPYYSIMDGVLYSFDKTILVKFPANHSTSFEIPNSVATIEFCASVSYTHLTLPTTERV